MKDKASETTATAVKQLGERFNDIKNNSSLSAEDKLTRIKDELRITSKDNKAMRAARNTVWATLNDCLAARKCKLVPYQTHAKDEDGSVIARHSNDGGCCPGQTGHHLIYGCMIQDKNSEGVVTATRCKEYNHSAAPTVCVEGASQYHGSHGRVHRAMDDQLDFMIDEKIKNGEKIYRFPDGNAGISTQEAIDAAVNAHEESFKASKCDRNCIRAQLAHHYSKMCAGATLKAKKVTGKGTKNSPPASSGRKGLALASATKK